MSSVNGKPMARKCRTTSSVLEIQIGYAIPNSEAKLRMLVSAPESTAMLTTVAPRFSSSA